MRRREPPEPEARPTIVCLCGSTRFKAQYIEANFRETMAGRIVLSVGWFGHADGDIYTPTPAEKIALDQLHLQKIDLADEVLVIDADGGYIGESTPGRDSPRRTNGKTSALSVSRTPPAKEPA